MQQDEPEGHQFGQQRRLLRVWGGTFRAIFIVAVGLGGYLLLDPPSIADRPLAGLTLRDVAKNILAAGLAIGCMTWFFKFPDEFSLDNVLSYEDWGKFGGWVALGAVLIAWIIIGNS